MPDRGANEPQNMTAASAACRPLRSCALTRRRGDRGPTPDQIAVITAVTLARQNSIGQRLPANFPEHVVDPGARLASNSCGNVARVRKQRRRQEEGVTSSSRLMKANPQPFQLLQTDARLSGSAVFPPRRWPPPLAHAEQRAQLKQAQGHLLHNSRSRVTRLTKTTTKLARFPLSS